MPSLRDTPDAEVPEPTQALRARWFGQPTLSSNSSADAHVLALGKPLALLAYLDCAFRKAASRESLIALLWSDDADARGRQNLRQTLFYIKQRLGRDVIESDGDRLSLTVDFASDRATFERAIEQQHWSEAVAAYAGPFLVGFAAPGSSGMEQWIAAERTRLQRLFLGAADALAKELLSTGRAREAVAVARRARDEMRGDQAAWRILLEAQISAQDYLSALAEANALEEQIANDGDELEPATKSLIKTAKARNGTQANGNSHGEHVHPIEAVSATLARDLIAREHEFSTIIDGWDSVRNDRGGQWIHLEAPAGMGKSRLLSDIAARLRALRGGVIEVRASPGERDVSCAFAAHVAAALASRRGARGISEESASVIVGLAPTASTHLRANTSDTAVGNDAMRRRALAIGELLQCVAQENSIALLLDDLHWADAESRVVLDAVFPKARDAGLLLLTAGRSLGAHDFASAPDVSMRLRGFDAPEIAQLLTDAAVLPDAPWTTGLVERLLLTTGGSPLLVIESVQRAMDAGVLRMIDQQWTCSDPLALERLLEQGSAIRFRVKQLDADANFLLVALALAGLPTGEDVLGRIGERRLQAAGLIAESSPMTSSTSDAKPVLVILEQRGMLRRRGAAWDVAHDEIAEAAVALADAAMLQRAHESTAWALLANGDRSPEVLVRALRHLVSASVSVPSWLVRRVVVSARHRGDERALPAVVTDVLRGVGGPTEVAAVVQAAPWRLRADRSMRAIAVAALLLAAVGVGAFANRWFAARPALSSNVPATTVLLSLDSDTTQLYEIKLSGIDWNTEQPLQAVPVARGSVPIAPWRLPSVSQSGRNPEGKWLMRQDSGANLEVAIVGDDGKSTPIAPDPADDVQPMWSSDNQSVLFGSRRWDLTDDHAEIAYWDAKTRDVTRLTNSPYNKFMGTLSPDGFAFVYTEDGATPQGIRICWRNVPGYSAQSGCMRPEHDRLSSTSSPVWLDANSVIVQLLRLNDDNVEQRVLARMNLTTGQTRDLVTDGVEYFVSANGQWILSRHSGENGSTVIRVRPTLRRDQTRDIVLKSGGRPAQVRFAAFQNRRDEMDRNAPFQFADTSIHVSIDATDSDFLKSVKSSSLLAKLTSSDTTIFAIDSARRIHPRTTGRAWLVASLGSTVDSVWVVVDPPRTSREVISEDWSMPLQTRWVAHGLPVPTIVKQRDRTFALAPNGDGDYHSAVTSIVTLDAKGGAGVEIEVETPIDATKWQGIGLALDAGLTDARVRSWPAGMDALPDAFTSPVNLSCLVGYPAREGSSGVDRLIYSAGMSSQISGVTGELKSGKPYTIRIQIFDDGSCQVAINGKAMARQLGRVPTDGKFRIWISGASVGTNVRVRRVTAWEGVKHDVEWPKS